MNENRRYSTLFHLVVPGGKWVTQIDYREWRVAPASARAFRLYVAALERSPKELPARLPGGVQAGGRVTAVR